MALNGQDWVHFSERLFIRGVSGLSEDSLVWLWVLVDPVFPLYHLRFREGKAPLQAHTAWKRGNLDTYAGLVCPDRCSFLYVR